MDTASTPRAYRLWAIGFTPSPGPRRLYGKQAPSVITGVLVDYMDAEGREVEVARIMNDRLDADGELAAARAASRACGRHFLDNKQRGGMTIEGEPGLLAKSEPPLTAAYIREMSQGG